MKDTLLDALKALLTDSVGESVQAKLPPLPSDFDDDTSLNEKVFISPPSEKTLRVYSLEECRKLDTHCRDFILYSEQLGLISPQERETVIHHLMASDSDKISEEELKWALIELTMNELSHERLNFLDFILFPDNETAH